MEIAPGEVSGGGASRANRLTKPKTAGNSKLAWSGANAGFCPCSGENRISGTTATFSLRIWQHELFMSVPRIGQSCAIPRQHAGIPIERTVSKQADAGIVDHRATTANIVNAPFLLQFMMFRFQVLTVRITRRRSGRQ